MLISLLSEPVMLAIIAIVPSLAIGFYRFRRSVRNDRRLIDEGASAFQLGLTRQAFDGVIEHNKSLLKEIAELRKDTSQGDRSAEALERLASAAEAIKNICNEVGWLKTKG